MKTNMRTLFVVAFIFTLLLAIGGSASADSTITVKPSGLNGWGGGAETGATATGGFVTGPDTPPLGVGSLSFQTPASADGYAWGTLQFNGTRFDQITDLEYSTYRTSPVAQVQAVALQFNVDYDLTDANVLWQGRLVYEPYQSGETISDNVWQTWSPLDGKWWGSGGDGKVQCPQATPCTWAQVLSKWPNAGIHTTQGAVILKAGSGWTNFDGNADALTIGIDGENTTFNFEPETACTSTCYADAVNGNDAFGGDSPASAKKTIQAAVDAVDAGGTVIVAEGTYAENVVINKSGLTLEGANANVCANSSDLSVLNPSRGAESIISPGSGDAFTIATNVDNITIDGFFMTSALNAGVYAWNASDGAFENITIVNNRVEDIVGWGIFSGGADRIDWRIQCNRFDGWTGVDKTAVWLAGNVNRNLTVTQNFVQNVASVVGGRGFIVDGAEDVVIQNNAFRDLNRYAIQLTNSSDGVLVDDNDIRNVQVGVQLLTSATGATGVLKNVTVQNNTITDVTAIAIYLSYATTGGPGPGTLDNLIIAGNVITQNVAALTNNFALIDLRIDPNAIDAHGAIAVNNNQVTFNGSFSIAGAAHGIQVRGKASSVSITGNTLNGGNVGGSATNPPTSAIVVRTTDSTFGTIPSGAEITATKNIITGFKSGVSVFDSVANVFGGLPSGVKLNVNRNSITQNTAGFDNSGTSTLANGECNWWGAADGPSGVFSGGGDSVSANVDFIPFLMTSDLDGDCSVKYDFYLKKSIQGDGDPTQQFTFENTYNGDPQPTITFNGAGIKLFDNVLGGEYTFTEVVPPTWRLANIECFPDDPTVEVIKDPENRRYTVKFTLDENADPNECIFYNEQPKGSVTVTKSVNWNGFPVPANAPEFEVCLTGVSTVDSTQTYQHCEMLAHGESFTAEGLPVLDVAYSVSEPTLDPLFTASGLGAVTVEAGKTANVTVTNTHAAFSNLNLTSDCPSGTFRVTNPNGYPVDFTWDLYQTSISGSGTAAPGANFGAIVTGQTSGTVRLFVNGVQQATKATKPPADCVGNVNVTKTVDWNGFPPIDPSPEFKVCLTGVNTQTSTEVYNECVMLANGASHTFTNLEAENIAYSLSEPELDTALYTATFDAVTLVNGQTVNATVTNTFTPQGAVKPVLECVIDNYDGTFTARFGYMNENSVAIEIPVGENNKFTPAPEDRGQTTMFQPGRVGQPGDVGAFSVAFDGSNLVWTLKGPDGSTSTATASSNSKRCPDQPEPPRGKLTIQKVAQGGEDVTFSFSVSGPSLNTSFNVQGGGLYTFENVKPGSYTVTEGITPNWSFSGATCSNASFQQTADGVVVTVESGKHATCTFTNIYTPHVCTPEDIAANWKLDLKVHGQSALLGPDFTTGRVVNTNASGKNCTYPVGIASYKKFDEVIDNQELFDYELGSVGPNETLFLTVGRPECAAQIDLFYGQLLTHLNGQRYGERLLAVVHVGGQEYCTHPVPNEKPTAVISGETSATLTCEQESATFALSGINSTDSDGTITAYAWSNGQTTADALFTLGVGTHEVTLTVTDDDSATNQAKVTLTVHEATDCTPPNTAPAAFNGEFSGDEDTTINGNVSATDAESDPLTFILVTGTANGALTFNPDGSFSYQPNQDFNGTDSFTFKVNDGELDSNIATVSLIVNPVNDTPAIINAAADPNVVDLACDVTSVTVNLLADAIDIDGNSLSFVWAGNGVNGSIAELSSTTEIFLTVSDGNGGEVQTSFIVTVNAAQNCEPQGDDTP